MTNAEFAARTGHERQWIVERTGIRGAPHRRRVPGLERPRAGGGRAALDAAGVRAEDIDLIIVATSTPDKVFPSTACLLQRKLGTRIARPSTCRRSAAGSSTRWRSPTMLSARPGTAARWSSAPRCSRAFSTATIAAPACSSATAPARWCLHGTTSPASSPSELHADGTQVDILCVPGNVCGGRIVGSPYCRWRASRCSSSR